MILIPELWTNIFDSLPAVDVVHIGQTCNDLHLLTESYWSSTLNPSRVLVPFFPQNEVALAFLELMRQCDALISGSIAQQLFARTCYTESDLDVYVHTKQSPLMNSQLKTFGYLKKDSEINSTDEYFPLHEVIDSIESYASQKTEKIIQIISTKKSPLEAVLSFHSSTFQIGSRAIIILTLKQLAL